MKGYLLLGLLAFSCITEADLLISPTSVLISDKERVKEVILLNSGTETNTYRLSFKDMLQDENGAYKNVAEEDFEFSAAKFIRFSPRQVSLKPGERQTVKLLVRRNKSLQGGDYRSHLNFKVLPKRGADKDLEVAQAEQAPGIKLTPMLSYSIPVVVQIGDTDVDISLTQLSLQTSPESNRRTVTVSLSRQGKNGVFGKIELFATDLQGESKLVGVLNNANIFRESAGRTFSVDLNNEVQVNSGDLISVKYTDIGARKTLLSQVMKITSE